MFAFRPFWRWQTQGTFAMGFNAIMNWNDLDAGRVSPRDDGSLVDFFKPAEGASFASFAVKCPWPRSRQNALSCAFSFRILQQSPLPPDCDHGARTPTGCKLCGNCH